MATTTVFPQPVKQNVFVQTWLRLTAPHPSITDVEQRRQSRLLASLLIMLAPLLVLSFIVNAIGGQPPLILALSPVLDGVILAAYFLNRAGRYAWSASVTAIASATIVSFGSLSSGSLNQQFQWITILILAAILLPARRVIALALVGLLELILFAVRWPGTYPVPTIFGVQLFLFAGATLLIYTVHRSAVERERQAELRAANDQLRESERLLEVRVEDRTHDLGIARLHAETVSAVTQKMSQASDEYGLLQSLAALTADTGTLFHIFTDEEGQPKYIASAASLTAGMPDHSDSLRTRTFRPEQMPVLKVALERPNDPIYNFANDPERTEFERQQAQQRGVEVVVGIALQSSGQWQGMLTLGWKDATKIDAGMRALLKDLASPLAD